MSMGEVKFLEGNEAAAYGVKLCRPDMISAFPITPQTPLVNHLARMKVQGEIQGVYQRVESEHSSMSHCVGASAAGGRAFTASCSQGIAYMTEVLWMASGFRLPIVMAVVNRGISCPGTLQAEQGDSLQQRDIGWLQLYCEDGQEVLDTIVQAYRIAEDECVYLPVMVCYDGYTTSHTATPVEIPQQEIVDTFLPPYKHKHIFLDPENPREIGVAGPKGGHQLEIRLQMENVMRGAIDIIEEVDSAYGDKFGRSYGGVLDEYRTENADALLFTMGAITGTARGVIDEYREAGRAIGLVKIRSFRPYPIEEVKRVASSVKCIGVIDRNFSLGSAGGGVGCLEVGRAVVNLEDRPKIISFISGLGGRDVVPDNIRYCADVVLRTAETGKVEYEVEWVGLKED
jgi:pyruvate/2-oxoacid:ferredoxin oxidoreductase alpha subunit